MTERPKFSSYNLRKSVRQRISETYTSIFSKPMTSITILERETTNNHHHSRERSAHGDFFPNQQHPFANNHHINTLSTRDNPNHQSAKNPTHHRCHFQYRNPPDANRVAEGSDHRFEPGRDSLYSLSSPPHPSSSSLLLPLCWSVTAPIVIIQSSFHTFVVVVVGRRRKMVNC